MCITVNIIQLLHKYFCCDPAPYCSQSQISPEQSAKRVQHINTQRQYVCSNTQRHTWHCPFRYQWYRGPVKEKRGHVQGLLDSYIKGWSEEWWAGPLYSPFGLHLLHLTPTAPTLSHPSHHHPLHFHLCLYGIICIWHWLCCSLLRSFLSLLRGSRDNNKSSLLLDKDDLFSLSNQAVTGWVYTQRTALSLPLFICGYQLNEWVIAGCMQAARKLGKNTNTPRFFVHK